MIPLLDELQFQAARALTKRLVAKEHAENKRYARLLELASKETTDTFEAMLIAEAALSLQPTKEVIQSNGVQLAFDIFNRKAQSILNRALKASAELSAAARVELRRIASLPQTQMVPELIEFISKYRSSLTKLLGATNLAALLEGAAQVAKKMPALPPRGSLPPVPPSIEPADADRIIRRLRGLTAAQQEEEIYRLPPEQQAYVRAGISVGPVEGHPLRITPPLESDPAYMQFPIIEQAARILGEKNVVNSWTFHRLDDATRQKAFTVTGVDAQATLTKIRDAIVKNIQEGADFEDFRDNILKSVEEGTFLSDSHLEVVFRTAIQTAFSDGQMAVLSHPFIRSGFPYASYEAIHDDRVRHEHLALEKLGIEGTSVYLIADPVFQLFRPAWDFNCRCSWVPMTIRQAAEAGVTEAQRWLETGKQPYPPAYVDMPPFQPPPTFKRSISQMPLSIQLSLEPMEINLAQQLREGSGEVKPDPKIDENLWKQCKALIPERWYEAQKVATEIMASYGIPTKPEDFPYTLGKLDLEGIGEVTVDIIDGDKEMLEHDMDFTQGGNSAEDPDFGEKRIVLDNRMCLPLVTEFPPITYHEGNEYEKMEVKKWDYDPAHDDSNGKEKFIRIREDEEDKGAELARLLSIREYDEALFEKLHGL